MYRIVLATPGLLQFTDETFDTFLVDERPLLQQHVDLPAQTRPFLGRQLFGCDHYNRDAAHFRVRFHGVDNAEAIHAGHHQIGNHQIGPDVADDVDTAATFVGHMHLIFAPRFQYALD